MSDTGSSSTVESVAPQSRAEIVAAMRAFNPQTIRVDLVDDKYSEDAPPEYAKLYTPKLVTWTGYSSFGVLVLPWMTYMTFRYPRSGEPLPWAVENSYWIEPTFWTLFILGLAVTGFRMVRKKRRMKVEAQLNNLEMVPRDFSFAPVPGHIGTLSSWGDVYSLNGIAARGLRFGSVRGCWSPVNRKFRVGSGRSRSYPTVRFVHLRVPGLNMGEVYVESQTQLEVELRGNFDAKALRAIEAMTDTNVLYFGNEELVLAGSGPGATMSGDIDSSAGWKEIAEIVSGPLADLVEGLKTGNN
ncbi:MAG: hypothetical protein ACKOWK_02665 [Micrococcales bacterium]